MKIMHFRKNKTKSKGQQVITVVSELDQEKGMLQFGFAVCSKNDSFNKKKGAQIARDRFNMLNGFLPDDPIEGIDYTKYFDIMVYTGAKDHLSINDTIWNAVHRELIRDQLSVVHF